MEDVRGCKLKDVGVPAAIVSVNEVIGALPANDDDEDTLG